MNCRPPCQRGLHLTAAGRKCKKVFPLKGLFRMPYDFIFKPFAEMTPEDYAWVGTRMSLNERPTYRRVVLAQECSEAYADDEVKDAADAGQESPRGLVGVSQMPSVPCCE